MEQKSFKNKEIGFLYPDSAFVTCVKNFLDSDANYISQELNLEMGHESARYYLIVAQKYSNLQTAVVVGMDITKRKFTEKKLEQLNNELNALNQASTRFVPIEFLKQLNQPSVLNVKLGDQVERNMSILFSDIRGFTKMSETMTPKENIDFINNYLKVISPAIPETGGFIDKYIGDAIMALFPDQEKNADHAVQAAIKIFEYLTVLNQQREGRAISIGIGVNTGMLMLGTIGDEQRMDGTVISDAVNLAARLEEMTKRYRVNILISEYTYQQLSDVKKYHIRLMAKDIKVTGRNKKTTIYELYDGDSNEMISLKLLTLKDFEAGVKYYHNHELAEAHVCFQKVIAVHPEDTAAQFYAESCVQQLTIHPSHIM
jgi:class 3 adenylate cyclase